MKETGLGGGHASSCRLRFRLAFHVGLLREVFKGYNRKKTAWWALLLLRVAECVWSGRVVRVL